MKKFLAIAFALTAAVSLSACDTVGKGKGKAPVEVTG